MQRTLAARQPVALLGCATIGSPWAGPAGGRERLRRTGVACVLEHTDVTVHQLSTPMPSARGCRPRPGRAADHRDACARGARPVPGARPDQSSLRSASRPGWRASTCCPGLRPAPRDGSGHQRRRGGVLRRRARRRPRAYVLAIKPAGPAGAPPLPARRLPKRRDPRRGGGARVGTGRLPRHRARPRLVVRRRCSESRRSWRRRGGGRDDRGADAVAGRPRSAAARRRPEDRRPRLRAGRAARRARRARWDAGRPAR